jgi:hypothetical protein
VLRGKDVQEIEGLRRQGLSIRAISDLTGYDRKTIRRALSTWPTLLKSADISIAEIAARFGFCMLQAVPFRASGGHNNKIIENEYYPCQAKF